MNLKPTIKFTLTAVIAIAVKAVLADDTNNLATSSSMQAPVSAQEFVWDASVANLKEVRLGDFAEQNSTNEDVKSFARHMVHDHLAANRHLTKAALADGFNLPDTNSFYIFVNNDQPVKQGTQLMQRETPESVLRSQQISARQVEAFSGADFDKAYADAMVKDHVGAIQLFENASENVTNEDLKRIAIKTLPTLRHHLEMAQTLQNEVGGSQVLNAPNSNSQTNSGSVSQGTGI
jgi:putative membrane protein